MQLHTHRLQNSEIIHLSGGIESTTFPLLADEINGLLNKSNPQIVLECSKVSYIGSAELKELLDFAHTARARGGNIKCARLAPTIEQVATLIANGDPLECFPDTSEALASFHGSALPA